MRTPVEAVAKPDRSLDCEWGSSTFKEEPRSWYGCWNAASGSLRRVAREYESRIAAQGFVVSSRTDGLSVQLTGVLGARTLCVDVLAHGYTRARNTSPSEVNPPRGKVFVDVWAVELRETGPASRPCRALPEYIE